MKPGKPVASLVSQDLHNCIREPSPLFKSYFLNVKVTDLIFFMNSISNAIHRDLFKGKDIIE